MSEPRHISECITEWFDDYERQHMDPFNLPDALTIFTRTTSTPADMTPAESRKDEQR